MLNAYVDALGDDSGVDSLVDDNTDSARGDIPDTTSASMVVLVGHTLVDLTVGLDIHILSQLVGGQVGLSIDGTVFTESNSELVSGSSSVTV